MEKTLQEHRDAGHEIVWRTADRWYPRRAKPVPELYWTAYNRANRAVGHGWEKPEKNNG